MVKSGLGVLGCSQRERCYVAYVMIVRLTSHGQQDQICCSGDTVPLFGNETTSTALRVVSTTLFAIFSFCCGIMNTSVRFTAKSKGLLHMAKLQRCGYI